MEKFSVIIPTADRKEGCEDLIDELESIGPELEDIIVVADGFEVETSSQRTCLITNDRRVGKAEAVNQALEQNESPITVLLSADLKIEAETVEKLAGEVRNGADLAAPKIVPDGNGGKAWRIARTIWSLHDKISSQETKAGEAIAFRPEGRIPGETIADEELPGLCKGGEQPSFKLETVVHTEKTYIYRSSPAPEG
ncbi:MAG: glycosyltransferase [Candidatus Nanohaloarchaea archaeon]